MTFINEKNKKYDAVFIAVIALCCAEMLFYAYVGIRGIGTMALGSYLSIFIVYMMYTSIIKYVINYFKKGEECSLDDMLFKFGMSTMAALLGLKEGNNTVFTCTAIMLFLVPQVMGGWKNVKKQVILMAIVYVCTIICAVINIAEPVEKYLSFMGSAVYTIDALTQVIEWTIFFVLAGIRYLIHKEANQELK